MFPRERSANIGRSNRGSAADAGEARLNIGRPLSERTRLTSQLENLNGAISASNGIGNPRTGRTISAAGRARIAAAQRARWAKIKARKAAPIAKGTGLTLSAAARRRIVAAQKPRWVAWRKKQKAA